MRLIASFAAASAAIVAARASEVEEFVVNALTALSPVKDDPQPSVNPRCVAKYCLTQGKDCFLNKDCRSALKCVAGCGKGVNQTCIFQCNSDFENDVYDNLTHCMFNEHDCMGTKEGYDLWNKCRPIEKVAPMKTYRGKPLTVEVARQLVTRGTRSRGDWMVAKGISPAYDCFPCQFLYWVEHPDRTMNYIANFKVLRSNGGVRWNNAFYNSFEWYEGVGRYNMNASNDGGLAHFEDWRFLAADESDDPQWLAFYYCGSVPGVGEAYEGAFLLTPDGNVPKDPAVVEKITKMFGNVGLVLQCKTNNDDCSGHPPPPTSSASTLVI